MKCKICMKDRCNCKYESNRRLRQESQPEIHQKRSFDSRMDLLKAVRERMSSSKLQELPQSSSFPVNARQPSFLPFDEYLMTKNAIAECNMCLWKNSDHCQPPAEAMTRNQQVSELFYVVGFWLFPNASLLMLQCWLLTQKLSEKNIQKNSSSPLTKKFISVEFLKPSRSVVKRDFYW